MSLPVNAAQFTEVFARYNDAVWPAQLALEVGAIACVAALSIRAASRFICAVLAVLWLWCGVVYHGTYLSPVNPAAGAFAALFVGGAAVLGWQGAVHDRLQFALPLNARSAAGLALIAYALIGYPMLSMWLGHAYPAMPTFGAPSPLTLFTLGMLAFLRPPYPRSVLVAPLAWALIAAQAALSLRMYEDLGLAAAGLAGAWFALQPFSQRRPA